jgi:hypothetical protein
MSLSTWGGPGFDPYRLQHIVSNHKRVPCGSPCLGHMAPYNLPIKFHMLLIHSPTCLPLNTFHIITFQLNTDTSTLANSSLTCHLPRVGPYPTMSSCTDCKVNKILLVWKNEHNVISHSSDVHLNPFKFLWVREDEAYTPVRFEVIPSTFIFGLIFYP